MIVWKVLSPISIVELAYNLDCLSKEGWEVFQILPGAYSYEVRIVARKESK